MRKILSAIFVLAFFFLFGFKVTANAQTSLKYDVQITPIPCATLQGCHPDLNRAYQENPYYRTQNHSCATSYEDFLTDPRSKHFWIEDPDITALGKADERARQFIYWTVTRSAIDDHPALKSVWGITRNIALFLTLIVAAILGLGLMIGQRMQFDFKIQVWPVVYKILMAVLYVTFSATIVILFIQLSEVLMKFFNETLRGKDLFNIYFGGSNPEENYVKWVGCRDINIRTKEGVDTEVMMLKLTNITYYVMGAMLLLRKIILWFLLFVSPLLAILMPFVFIRNTGWIWIGVFFQWLFYGPLFALFLGATAKMWNAGIPFLFNFSRANTPEGYIYPTAINILYGGPSQHPIVGLPLKNANYADTFVEYVITLIMLWAVTFFPWWLLRIFRDYCCEGIMAMKNILLAMYDQSRGGPPSPTPSGPIPSSINAGSTLKFPEKITVPISFSTPTSVKLERIEEVREAKTQDIMRTLQISTPKLTDIARFETNKTLKETVNKSIEYLQNPMKAQTSTERQQFMNVKTELFNRAIKEDHIAKQVLSSISTSRVEQVKKREEFTHSISSPQKVPLTNIISVKVNIPQQQVSQVTQNYTNTVATNTQAINEIATSTRVSAPNIKSILTTFGQSVNQPAPEIVTSLEKQTGIKKDKIITVLKAFHKYATSNKDVAKKIAEAQKITPEQVQKVLDENVPVVTQEDRHLESAIAIPPSISLEDYEEVKKMWKSQYEKGEVPVSTDIASRAEWVDSDVVFITNTLNKLMSTDEKLKQQALDELGYILPVFMVNNFSGEELLVYLKAKLEAAREIKESLVKEQEIKSQVTQEEEFVDISATQTQKQAQEMHLSEAQSIPREGEDVGESTTTSQTATTTAAKRLTDIARLETGKNIHAMTQQILSTVSSADIEKMHKVADVFEKLSKEQTSIATILSTKFNVPQEQVQQVSSSLINSLTADNVRLGEVAQATKSTQQEVQRVLQSISQNLDKTALHMDSHVATATNLQKLQVSQITTSAFAPFTYAAILQSTSQKSNSTKEEVATLLSSLSNKVKEEKKDTQTASTLSALFKEIAGSPVTSALAAQTNTPVEKAQSTLASLSQNVTSQSGSKVIENVSRETGVTKDQVDKMLLLIEKQFKDFSSTLKVITQQTKVSQDNVEKTIGTQSSLLTQPQKNVSDLVTVPATVSLEDYEEVKKMWQGQYEKGEVPVSDQIKTRTDWVNEDVVFITNTLNKLLSTDEKLRNQGLDDLGYILPVFMTNNFSGEEILVYLKAKLEAAKETAEKVRAETAVAARIGEQQKEYINVPNQTVVTQEKIQSQVQQIPVSPSVTTSSSQNIAQTDTATTARLSSIARIETIRDTNRIQEITKTISSAETSQRHTDLLKTLPAPIPVIQVVSTIVKVPQEQVQQINSVLTNALIDNKTLLSELAQSTNLTSSQIQTVLQTISKNLETQSLHSVNDATAATANVKKEQVSQIAVSAFAPFTYAAIVQSTAKKTNVDKEQVVTLLTSLSTKVREEKKDLQSTQIVSSLLKEIASSPVVSVVAQQTNISTDNAKAVFSSLSNNVTSQPGSKVIENVSREAGVTKDQVDKMLLLIEKQFKDFSSTLKVITQQTKVKQADAEKAISAQASLITQPQRSVDKTISIPPSTSLEDYEEVKKMWQGQYEKGEVPVSDQIKTRADWVNQDTVFITNTLNKLMSTDEKLKQQALDGLGYILPVFMVNNFSGEELLVYLKAKLEAARAVEEKMKVEADVTSKLQAEQQKEFVEVERETTVKAPQQASQTYAPLEERISAGSSSTQTSPRQSEATTKLATVARFETIGGEKGMRESSKQSASSDTIQKQKELLKTLPAPATIAQIVSSATKLPQAQVQSISDSLSTALSQNTTLLKEVADKTKLSSQQVQSVLQALSQNTATSAQTIHSETAKTMKLQKDQISAVASRAFAQFSYAGIVETTIKQAHTSHEKVDQILSTLSNQITSDKKDALTTNVMSTLLREVATSPIAPVVSAQTNIDSQKTQKILVTLSQNSALPQAKLYETVTRETGVSKDQIDKLLVSIEKQYKDFASTLKVITAQTKRTPDEVTRTIGAQTSFLTQPEKHVDKTISIPPSTSLEDYEEVKKMWQGQYEKGEVPVSDQIKTRTDWVNEDVVFITNTLNKLLSTDEKLRNQGLDDLGYILPVFMTNNFSGEEILVYLKAKLEAARAVEEKMKVEADVTTRLQTQQPEFVTISNTAKTAPQEVQRTIEEKIIETDSGKQSQTQSTQKVQTVTLQKLVDIVSREMKKDLKTTLSQEEQEKKKKKVLQSLPGPKGALDASHKDTNLTQDTVQSLTQALITALENNKEVLSTIAKETSTTPLAINNILRALNANSNQPANQIIEKVSQDTKTGKEKVGEILKKIYESPELKKDVAQELAKKHDLKPKAASKLYDSHGRLALTPGAHIEDVVAIPGSLSIDDFEEIKKMWRQQYERGEVPISEKIKTRLDWVNYDVVFITNALEKLLSTDDKLKQEGLDSLGEILPIFMVNNLTGEEILVYLKAKVAAAREVKELLEKQDEITTKLKAQIPEIEVLKAKSKNQNTKEQAKSKKL